MQGFPVTHLVCLPGRRWDCYWWWCRQPRCRSAWRPRSWAGWPRTLCHLPICSASRMLWCRGRQKEELFIRRGLQRKYINFHGCGHGLQGSAAANDCFGFYQDLFSWDCCIHENNYTKKGFSVRPDRWTKWDIEQRAGFSAFSKVATVLKFLPCSAQNGVIDWWPLSGSGWISTSSPAANTLKHNRAKVKPAKISYREILDKKSKVRRHSYCRIQMKCIINFKHWVIPPWSVSESWQLDRCKTFWQQKWQITTDKQR